MGTYGKERLRAPWNYIDLSSRCPSRGYPSMDGAVMATIRAAPDTSCVSDNSVEQEGTPFENSSSTLVFFFTLIELELIFIL